MSSIVSFVIKEARYTQGKNSAGFDVHRLTLHSHYVAFVRKHLPDDNKNRSWVLFNDEKVVKAADVDEMKK